MPDTNPDNDNTRTAASEQSVNSAADESVKTNSAPPTNEAYREHSNAHEELQKAVDSVPLKDYSDYEITLETKEHYQDALFSDEAELNQALTQASNEQTTTEATDTTQQSNETASPTNELIVEDIDYRLFLTEEAMAGFVKTTAESVDKINIINNRLNDSPARKAIVKTAKAEQFDNQLVHLEEKINTEKKLAAEAAEEKLKAPASHSQDSGKLARITQKLKTKSKELSLKGIAQFDKSKAELDEYLGRSLPERELALNFILPTLKPKKEQGSLPSKENIEKFFAIKGKPLAVILKKASSDLGNLSKSPLSNSQRLEILDCYMPPLSEKIESLISMFERKPSVIDEGKRLLILDNALSSLKHLITGYKQVYANLYESANVIYGPQRKTANDTAVKILSCLHLEKRLAVATHSNTTHNSAKTFNTVFHALRTYEPQVLTQPLLATLSGNNNTITQLFVHYQLLQAFDFKYISTGQHRLLHRYLDHHRGLLELIEPELTDSLISIDAGQQLWQCFFDADTPTLISGEKTINNTEAYKPVYIKVQTFLNQIKTDYVASLKLRIHQRKKFNPASLGEININQALTLLSAMNLLVTHCESHIITPEYTVYRPTTISAYTSIKTITDYFSYRYATQTKGPKTKNSTDKPKPLASKSQWQCATEDEDFIYLQTAEDKLAITLDVGDLILLVRTSEDTDDSVDGKKTQAGEEAQVEIIGKVSHLDRSTQGKLGVAIQKLAREACIVLFEENETIGILTRSAHNHRLILTSDNSVASNQQLTFTFPDSSTGQLAINGLEHLNNDGDIFALH